MKTILVLAVIAGQSLGSEAEARARAAYAYAAAMTEEPEQANVIEFKNLDALASPAQPAGEWRAVQVCPGNGQQCYLEQRWFPAQNSNGASSVIRPAVESGINDALDELNAQRAQRGLRPYVRDDGLTRGAQACANARAAALLFEHTANDFAYLPQGCSASAAGCAAYPASYGFMACSMYENWTYAGAAYAMGADGKRYCHLFVR